MNSAPRQRLVLLGDSVLDNGRYTTPESDTTGHLRALLGPLWSVELEARDGATMDLLLLQLDALSGPPDVAVLSVGGNDAAGHLDILEPRSTTTTGMLTVLRNIVEAFEQ